MTSEQRIAVEAIAFANRFSSALSIPLRPDSLSLLEQMASDLIASVRAEAIEECAKVLDERSNTCAKKFPPTVAGHMCQALDVAAQMLRDRALVKERKP